MKSQLLSALSACVCSAIFCSTASAVLLPRLETEPDSGVFLAYYDDQLDISWATNAHVNGTSSWGVQMAWANSLTLGGISGWRLPNMDVDGDGTVVDCDEGGVAGCADNEMGFLYAEEGITVATPDPFTNLQAGRTWSGTDFEPNPNSAAWCFNFNNGVNCADGKSQDRFAWAVHDGDLPAAVPVPAPLLGGPGVALLLGLLGLAGWRKIRASLAM